MPNQLLNNPSFPDGNETITKYTICPGVARSQEFLLFSNGLSVDSHTCNRLFNYYDFTVHFEIGQNQSSLVLLLLHNCLAYLHVFILPVKSYYQVVKESKKNNSRLWCEWHHVYKMIWGKLTSLQSLVIPPGKAVSC